MEKLSLSDLESENATILKEQKDIEKNKKDRYVKLLYLITSEGTKTEPNYLNCLCNELRETGRFDLFYEYIDIQGKNKATKQLIRKTIGTRDNSGKTYDRVWSVFDKDSFKDFDEAIKYAEENNIQCAWSNESFELWLLLHFQDVDASLGRKDYNKKLEETIDKFMKKEDPSASFSYSKGNPNLYNLVKKYGNESNAFTRAKSLKQSYKPDTPFSLRKPCTFVDNLITELRHPETVFIQKV